MGERINYDHCLCCGSAAISKVLECKDHTVSSEFFEVWQCGMCTFRFTQNAPDADSIFPYYQSLNYVSHSDTKEGVINRLYHLVRSVTLKTKRELVKRVTGLKHGVLLDIGAGTGAFANTMQQSGWNVTGLEPDGTARANAEKKYNLQLRNTDELHMLRNESFDAITLWHVLEHAHDLHGYLDRFLQVLKPAGRLLIAVPNYTSYDAAFYKQNWASWDVPRHLYHFSPKSMEVLLKRKGFAVEAVKPMWFDSFYVSMLSEKYRFGRDNFARAVWVGLLSNMKSWVNVKKCSSLIYVVRKTGRSLV